MSSASSAWCGMPVSILDILVIPVLIGSMIIVSIIDMLTGGHLHDWLSIKPRALNGLPGLFCAPFLHMSYTHLIRNMVPLTALSILLLMMLATLHSPAWRPFLGLCSAVAFSGNVIVWLVARPNTEHAGASGLVFSLAGILLVAGIVEAISLGWPPQCSMRALVTMGCTVVTFCLYGGLLWGLAPTAWFAQGVSVEGHVAGFVTGAMGGCLLAYHVRGRLPSIMSRVVFGTPAKAERLQYGVVS